MEETHTYKKNDMERMDQERQYKSKAKKKRAEQTCNQIIRNTNI